MFYSVKGGVNTPPPHGALLINMMGGAPCKVTQTYYYPSNVLITDDTVPKMLYKITASKYT